MRRVWDITPEVRPGLNVWPGDTPPSREVLLDMRRGDHLTLSTLRSTVHVGAHADAPSHYGAQAPTIESMELERYLGPCHLRTFEGWRESPLIHPRLLLASGRYDPYRADGMDETFPALAAERIGEMAAAGVRLLGVDTPSVDRFDSKRLPVHAACLEHDVAIVEGLLLHEPPPGDYELIALPLRLAGFDGSPLRAVLREL